VTRARYETNDERHDERRIDTRLNQEMYRSTKTCRKEGERPDRENSHCCSKEGSQFDNAFIEKRRYLIKSQDKKKKFEKYEHERDRNKHMYEPREECKVTRSSIHVMGSHARPGGESSKFKS
jgi:hypothetical protein